MDRIIRRGGRREGNRGGGIDAGGEMSWGKRLLSGRLRRWMMLVQVMLSVRLVDGRIEDAARVRVLFDWMIEVGEIVDGVVWWMRVWSCQWCHCWGRTM